MKPIWEIVGIAVDAHYCGQTRDDKEKWKGKKNKRIRQPIEVFFVMPRICAEEVAW